MDNIQDFRAEENVGNSKYVRITRLHYKQNGKEKNWDVALTHDAVACLLFNKSSHNFVLVKQFRPPVYYKHQEEKTTKSLGGITYELCAGLIDKDGKSDLEICHEEIMEECGYDVPINNIERITRFFTSSAKTGQRMTLYFALVDDSMKKGEGGGIDDEMIEVFNLPLNEASEFMLDESKPKPVTIMYALSWFLLNKKDLL